MNRTTFFVRAFARIGLSIFCFLMMIWLLAPTLVVLPVSFTTKKSLAFPPSGFSFQWYENFFTNPMWNRALLTSLLIGLIVAVTATVVGTAAAMAINKLKNRSAGILKGILLIPMLIPGVVLALGIYVVFLEQGLTGTITGYVLAHTLLAIPFVLIAVEANLASFDTRLENAAASLGASRWYTFRTVTFPLIMPGILSGMLFAFVTSFDEVVISSYISGPELKTLPVQIFESMNRDTDPTVTAIGSLIFLLTLIIVSILMITMTKRRGA